MVFIPPEQTLPISISEHRSWNGSEESRRHACDQYSDAVRVLLSRERWSQIADGIQATFNTRLKRSGKRMARWKKVSTPLSWKYGRELVILAWGIEEADPIHISVALRNWQGLLPEERWWLYGQVASISQATTWRGKGRAWRKALECVLTENPIGTGEPPQTYELALDLEGASISSAIF